MATIIGGIYDITVDGRTVQVRGNATVRATQEERTVVMSRNGGLAGYTAVPQPGMISFDMSTLSNEDIEVLLSATDAVIRVRLQNGRLFVLRNATRTAMIEENFDEGQATIEFMGLGEYV